MRPIFYLPGMLYAGGVGARAWLYERGWLAARSLPAPVISVGNLTVGGTGKTPCVAWLANWLQTQGESVAILSRGYKRASRGRVEVSDGQTIMCGAEIAGDEPYWLAQSCPGVRVLVDPDRYAAGKWLAARAKVTVFLLDDGFQHLQLRRALNLLLVDATDELAQARLIPFGRLREPLAAMRRADAVIVTRATRLFDRSALVETLKRHTRADVPVFFAQQALTRLRRLDRAEPRELAELAGQPLAAFCGIARPARFFEDLAQAGLRTVWQRSFADHHRYTPEELAAVLEQAQRTRAAALVTTEKDAAKLPPDWLGQAPLPVYAAQLAFHCEAEAAFWRLLKQTLARPV